MARIARSHTDVRVSPSGACSKALARSSERAGGLALRLSQYSLSYGKAGSMKSVFTPASASHVRTTLAVSPGHYHCGCAQTRLVAITRASGAVPDLAGQATEVRCCRLLAGRDRLHFDRLEAEVYERCRLLAGRDRLHSRTAIIRSATSCRLLAGRDRLHWVPIETAERWRCRLLAGRDRLH